MRDWLRSLPAWFWAGLTVRLGAAPFLLQWFHPDERQMLEFAHYHAHGRLIPFLESELHLRNQTLPWLFSWLIRLADAIGFDSPQAWLILIHSTIAVVSWCSFLSLVRLFESEHPGRHKLARTLGWCFALFWAGPMLYSRGLLEAVSFPFAAWAFVLVKKRRLLIAGAMAGVAAFTRYPSALFFAGSVALALDQLWRERSSTGAPPLGPTIFRTLGVLLAGFLIALGAGGLADLALYGQWMESGPAYWAFNRPGGPGSAMFGHDSLYVYLKWFEFLFTPWLAPIFVVVAIAALAKRREILVFTLPYIVGHLLTPHREPRFMLPLTPFLVLAIAEVYASDGARLLAQFRERLRTVVRRTVGAVLAAHIALNFVWLPMHLWAQTQSALAAVILNYRVLETEAAELVSTEEPLIDALLPIQTKWNRTGKNESHLVKTRWILSKEPTSTGCIDQSFRGPTRWPKLFETDLARWLRIRLGRLWACSIGVDNDTFQNAVQR